MAALFPQAALVPFWGSPLFSLTVFILRPSHLLHAPAHGGAAQPAGRGGAAGAARRRHQPQRPGTALARLSLSCSGVWGQPSCFPPPGPHQCSLTVLQIHESSPLDLASEEPERLPCLRRLLQLGADVNAADKRGVCTPPSSPS